MKQLNRYDHQALKFAWAFVDDLYSEGEHKDDIDRIMAIVCLSRNESQETMGIHSLEVGTLPDNKPSLYVRLYVVGGDLERDIRAAAMLCGWEVEFDEKD